VIKWHAQIDKVLKDSSANLFKRNSHPTPLDEVKFWEKRRSNISNIYDQLIEPRVKTIGNILETIDSVYTATFLTTFKEVVTALHEADDVTLWFKPLVGYLLHYLFINKVLTLFLTRNLILIVSKRTSSSRTWIKFIRSITSFASCGRTRTTTAPTTA
jgi:hypothetical protein